MATLLAEADGSANMRMNALKSSEGGIRPYDQPSRRALRQHMHGATDEVRRLGPTGEEHVM